jgi:hypothetical protein
MTIRDAIETADSEANNAAINLSIEDSDESEGPPIAELNHISVGSPLQPILLSEVEQQHSDNSSFTRFRRKVNDALQNIVGRSINTSEDRHVSNPIFFTV